MCARANKHLPHVQTGPRSVPLGCYWSITAHSQPGYVAHCPEALRMGSPGAFCHHDDVQQLH